MKPSEIELPVQSLLSNLHNQLLPVTDGHVADYIPELAKVDPNLFGIALVSLDGGVYQVGDSQHKFTIQSVSKPLTFALALSDQGIDRTNTRVGVEPSGDAFNSISLDGQTGRPLNPMINAGAIATAGLIKGDSPGQRFQRLLDYYSRYAGRQLRLDESVYNSEKNTGHRNRAISHLLRNFEMLEEDPEPHLDLYFRQCSVEVNCRDLAVMGATLANYGVNPITGVEVTQLKHTEKVLSVMATCGMYDYSGTWIYDVGLPAKSGVGGGIMAVLPGQFGLGIFSPRLDVKGNSVRGIQVCETLSRALKLHIFNGQRGNPTAVRAQYDATKVNSRRDRPQPIAQILEKNGKNVRVFELHGDLDFATTEHLGREILALVKESRYFVLGLERVMNINLSASQQLADLHKIVSEQGRELIFTHLTRHYRFRNFLSYQRLEDGAENLLEFADIDHALEWCENQLLVADESDHWPATQAAALQDFELFQEFSEQELDALSPLLSTVKFKKGDTILRENTLGADTSGCLYLIAEGVVSVTINVGRMQARRLASLGPGSNFGEMSMLDNQDRSATVIADTDVTCRVLVYQALESLPVDTAAGIRLKLLKNLGRQLSRKLRQANQEIRALS